MITRWNQKSRNAGTSCSSLYPFTMSGNGNDPIHPLLSTWKSTWMEQRDFMNKFHEGLFFTTLNEVIWPQKISNFMHGLKSAILAIFQKSADWLDWPCPVSVALKK